MNDTQRTYGEVCRSCGKPIVWMKTEAGKNMPCDADLVLFWKDNNGMDTVITREGDVVRCSLAGGDELASSGLGRVPHWATCDRPDEFRRGKKRT